MPDSTELARRGALVRAAVPVYLAIIAAEIARSLGISENTARRHAERVLGKLGVRSRREVSDVLRRRSGESSHV